MLERTRIAGDFRLFKWDNFKNAIDKAKIACENAGLKVSDHFADIGKMMEIGSNTKRKVEEKGKEIWQLMK